MAPETRTDAGSTSKATREHGDARRSRLPDALALVAAAVLLAGLVQSFAGAVRVGVTWDEPTHVERTQALLDVGWFVPEWRLVDGEPDERSPYVYGPAYSMTAHAGNVLVGNEAAGTTSEDAAAYVVRHLVVAVLGLLGAIGVGLTAWALTGSPLVGLCGAAVLVAIPAWTGHSMFNVKDLPAAAGYTLVTAGLVLALASAGGGRRRRSGNPSILLIAALTALGTFFGVGTRMAFWVPIGASFASFVALWTLLRLGGRDPSLRAALAAVAGAVAGAGGIVAVYPRAFERPLEFLRESVSGSSAYPWDGATLTAGRLLPSLDLPWWYLPVWFAASMPVLLLLLAITGLVVVARRLVTRDRHSLAAWWAVTPPTGGGVLVAQQALLLPLAAMAAGSVMYDGFRQHLYALPAVAVLAALGAHRLRTWASARPATARRGVPVAAGVLAIALLVPTVEQALLFPYNYTYVNPVAGAGGVDGRWETDFWKASGREAVTRVPADAELVCSSLVRPRLDRGPFYGPCQRDVTTFEHLRGTAVDEDSPAADAGTWLIGRRTEGNRPPDHCRSADDVTRWLRGERVVMAYVLVCDPDGF